MLLLFLFFLLAGASLAHANHFSYYFHQGNGGDVNGCISSAIAQIMQDTCLVFKHNPKAQNAILFLGSRRCGWQQSNSTVHLSPSCLTPAKCLDFVQHAVSGQRQHPATATRSLNLKFNCTGKCTTLCENGGSVNTRDCSCKCAYGFSGEHCEQLKLSTQFTDPSCGLITAKGEGSISLGGQVEKDTFCQWVLKADNQWDTLELEFEEMDLSNENPALGQRCGDQLYIYGVKGVLNPIPCDESASALLGQKLTSESNLLFIEYRGNRLSSQEHKGPILRYSIVSAPAANEIRSVKQEQMSGAGSISALWFPVGLLALFCLLLS